MSRSQNAYFRRLPTVTLTVLIGIGVAVAVLVFGQVSLAQAQGITVDGNGSDWDPSWVVFVDPYDATYTAETTATRFSTVTGHQYTRSGFEVLSFSAHFNADIWYFKLDIDGRPADADSVPGTDINHPGVGTTGYDSGALAQVDQGGLGDGEAYRIYFDIDGNNIVETQAAFIGVAGNGQLPDTAYPTTYVVGNAAYSSGYTPAGVVEFGLPKLGIFSAAQCANTLLVRAQGGMNQDSVADDYVPSDITFASVLNFSVKMNVITSTGGSNVVNYSIPYTISGSTVTPAHNAYITQTLDANSHFVSCSGCTHSGESLGGILTWTLASPITPPATGIVTSAVTFTDLGPETTSVALHADEGLCAQASVIYFPTLVGLSELRAESVGLINRFGWAALALVAAALVLFMTRRKARQAAQA